MSEAVLAPPSSPASAGMPPAPPDYLGEAADAIAKAVAFTPQAAPRYVQHRVGEAVRLYSALNGIREDLTPHYDSNVKRALAVRNPPLRAVLNLIIGDVVSHFQRPIYENAVGMKVQLKDRSETPTRGSVKQQQHIESILYKGGTIRPHPVTGEPAAWDSHFEVQGDTLHNAVRKLLEDSLTLDQAAVVIEGSQGRLNGGGHPVMFWRPEDGALMRFVDTPRYVPQIRTGYNGTDALGGRTKYIQLAPNSQWEVSREYDWREAQMWIRNPRTDLLTMGYGCSEIEQCMMALLGVLFCLNANQDYFTRNHIPMGFLNLIGNYSREDLSLLRLQLRQEVGYGTGGGLYDFPIIATPTEKGKGAEWLAMQDKSNFEGVGKLYIELCVALISAIFGVAPEEYGFSAFGGKTSTISDGDPESVIQNGKFRRLQLVLSLVDFLNSALVARIDDAFEIVIQGLENLYTDEATKRAELDLKLMQMGMTPNMLRARRDEIPIVDPKNLPLWRQLSAKLREQWFPNDTLRTLAIIEAYEAADGERCLWPDLPIGNPQALQIAAQEHGLQAQQDTQQQMGQMANDEASQQRSEEAAAQQGNRDQMGGLLQADDERSAAGEEAERDAASKDELRVPGVQDAALRKAQEPVRGGRIVVRIGPAAAVH